MCYAVETEFYVCPLTSRSFADISQLEAANFLSANFTLGYFT